MGDAESRGHLKLVNSLQVEKVPTVTSCISSWSADTISSPSRLYRKVKDECRRAGDNLVGASIGGVFVTAAASGACLIGGAVPGGIASLICWKFGLGPEWTKAVFAGVTVLSASQMMLGVAGSPRLDGVLEHKLTMKCGS